MSVSPQGQSAPLHELFDGIQANFWINGDMQLPLVSYCSAMKCRSACQEITDTNKMMLTALSSGSFFGDILYCSIGFEY